MYIHIYIYIYIYIYCRRSIHLTYRRRGRDQPLAHPIRRIYRRDFRHLGFCVISALG